MTLPAMLAARLRGQQEERDPERVLRIANLWRWTAIQRDNTPDKSELVGPVRG